MAIVWKEIGSNVGSNKTPILIDTATWDIKIEPGSPSNTLTISYSMISKCANYQDLTADNFVPIYFVIISEDLVIEGKEHQYHADTGTLNVSIRYEVNHNTTQNTVRVSIPIYFIDN